MKSFKINAEGIGAAIGLFAGKWDSLSHFSSHTSKRRRDQRIYSELGSCGADRFYFFRCGRHGNICKTTFEAQP